MSSDRVFVKIAVASLLLVFSMSACKKKKAFKEENGQAAEDVRRFQGQNDEAVKDVNVAVMEQSLLRGRPVSPEEINAVRTELCGVTVDTLEVFSGITRLRYNGTSCNGIKKTGSIVITVVDYPLHKWKHKGSVLKIDFLAYKVTGTDGKNIQYDGTEYLVNENGNTWYDLRFLNASGLVQTQTADNLKITYDGNNTAIFNINRRLTFNYFNNVTSCKVEGLGSSNGRSNLDNWGQNRDGNNFTTEIVTPVVWMSSCGGNSPVEGELSLRVDGKEFEMKCKFAVDQDGNSVSGDNPCPYGWKASWSYKKKTNTRVFAYN